MAGSPDGLWSIKVHAAYGWESGGVLSLENGRVVGGGDRHYSIGRYSQSEVEITIEYRSHYFGEPRTIFGEKQAEFVVEIRGQIDGDSITGVIVRPDKPTFKLEARMTRMAGADRTALGPHTG